MRIEDFDFDLPEQLIAQEPLRERDASRLLRVDRRTGRLQHAQFLQLPSLLKEGDLLVVNNSQVIQARLLGRKAETQGKAELLLVRPLEEEVPRALASATGTSEWVCLGQASKGLKPGTRLEFSGGLTAEILAAFEGGEVQARLRWTPPQTLDALLREVGRLPLPPYIAREPTAEDTERYQTVFAQSPGSVAAPTAGLHFTPRVLEALSERGIERVSVTLDVGPGTFLPVRDGDIDAHRMHEEHYFVPESTAEKIRLAKREGRRVVAVGTTVVRTLESAATRDERLLASGASSSALFIKPGFSFQLVDALITNFHLPRSTLLMLVSAFLGREHALNAYAEAVKSGYRFFSYGDAMLIGDFDAEG